MILTIAIVDIVDFKLINMTPKEKAEELVDSYKFVLWSEDTQCGEEILCTGIAKRCALIAVDLRLESDFLFTSIEYEEDSLEYWQQVKYEIEKI
jgi:hypothetical protein